MKKQLKRRRTKEKRLEKDRLNFLKVMGWALENFFSFSNLGEISSNHEFYAMMFNYMVFCRQILIVIDIALF